MPDAASVSKDKVLYAKFSNTKSDWTLKRRSIIQPPSIPLLFVRSPL